jgi:uncharacterized membrane protein YciS (DUF1049 family)
MIRKTVLTIILVPLVIILVTLAVANRQTVIVSFDPFDQGQPAFALALPLFALLLAGVVAGVVIGGVAAWLGQGKWRRAARLAQAQARELRAELDSLKRRSGTAEFTREGIRVDYTPRLTIPPPAA